MSIDKNVNYYQSEPKNSKFILNENDIQNNITKIKCPIELLYGLNNAFGMEKGT